MPPTPARVFARATAVPALALAAWLLVALPLLITGQFTPLAGLLLGVPAVVAALVFLPRLVPDPPSGGSGWWPLVATAAITVVFAAVQIAYHAEALVIRRDPSSYAQFTIWIAEHGSLPIPQQRELIAGDEPALSYESLAYYQVGDVIWPQFLAGAPLTLSLGYWIGGVPGMLVTAPLLGALGVWTFAGLAVRLIGARWAPLAALLLAVCLPQQWVSRSTYSEPAAQILLLGALALTVDALTRRSGTGGRWTAAHTLAATAGALFGLALVVRVDALRDILPVVVFCGMLLLSRNGRALPLLAGLVAGLGYGFTAAFGLSRPYLEHLSESFGPLLLITVGVVLGTTVMAAALWRRGVPRTDRPAWLPTAVGALVLVTVAALALRPLLFTQRGHNEPGTGAYVGQVQEIEGLPVEPARTYAETSLTWVGWYVGLPTVVLATLGAALLLRRVMLGRDTVWLLPLMVLSWSVATTLLRPSITPDHPWASRRLVVLVLPAFVLLAVWFTAWARRTLPCRYRSFRDGWVAASPAVAGVVLMLVPTLLTAQGVMTYRSDVGSVRESRQLCEALPADASVLIVDASAANYMQLIRGMCDVPTAAARESGREEVRHYAARIRERDRTPVLAASDRGALIDAAPQRVQLEHPFDVDSDKDPSTLTKPPAGPWPFTGDVWVAVLD
ncbi:hypothetical protein FHX37_0294 [Haloactinospora alba]|uniref:4-amino-4-deoxy-L-arabinose transferase-like glycosyltransferase n=1 Tax=Haloactinospora alba TaxID=405555 RepID=A0A543NF22_9ACTN|nr:hypothetical protein [Haloactinospora alba]TQN30416.1 hypothetical protein FHX37_0294 [Haloactinospora alba]